MYDGIINVYKEKGFTSFDVVAKMRGMFHQKKIGHTGTLDPDAEGVLPVCLGKATKVCDLLTDKDKEYKAVLLLGQETDTQDISGEIFQVADHHQHQNAAGVTGAVADVMQSIQLGNGLFSHLFLPPQNFPEDQTNLRQLHNRF